MSNLIVITSEMYKIAYFSINVKYCRPGNVVEYIPVEFEIFRDGIFYKAIPLQTTILTNLPKELLFQVKKGKVSDFHPGEEEVVEDIVNKLAELNLVERLKERSGETISFSSC